MWLKSIPVVFPPNRICNSGMRACIFAFMVVSCSWQPKVQRFFLQWHASGKQAVLVHVSACGGDKDIAQRVADGLKTHLDSIGKADKEEALQMRDLLIAEELQKRWQDSNSTSSSASQSSGGPHSAVRRQQSSDNARFRGKATVTKFTKQPPIVKKKKGDERKVMLLQLKRPHFEAIKSERKRWEGRPLFARGKDDRCVPWKQRHLATEGRVIKFQCGPPPTLDMQIAEVRCFLPNSLSSIPPEQAMVEELGAGLLPDAKDVHARVAIYHEIYGKDICAKGFVAMRLKWPDAAKMVNDVETKAKQLIEKRREMFELVADENYAGAAAAKKEFWKMEERLSADCTEGLSHHVDAQKSSQNSPSENAETRAKILVKQLLEKWKEMDELFAARNYAGAAATKEEVRKMEERLSADITTL